MMNITYSMGGRFLPNNYTCQHDFVFNVAERHLISNIPSIWKSNYTYANSHLHFGIAEVLLKSKFDFACTLHSTIVRIFVHSRSPTRKQFD